MRWVSLVATAPAKSRSSRSGTAHSPGRDREAPGREDFPGFPGQLAAALHRRVIENGEEAGAAAADIVRQESEGPAGGGGVPVGPGKLGHVPDEAVVRGHQNAAQERALDGDEDIVAVQGQGLPGEPAQGL